MLPRVPTLWRSAKARDSILKLALAGKMRPVVIPVAGGYQRVTVLEHVTLSAPYARIKLPGTKSQLYMIASGSGIIKPFHPPFLDLRDVSGWLTRPDAC